ncbi:MAG: hypothetical protein AB7F86_01895 [Bdellovibrionales bacterium]
MDELVQQFQSESLELVGQLVTILEEIEEDPSQFSQLQKYGNLVDRIMGTADTIASMTPSLAETNHRIGLYGKLCKVVSYKASRVSNNPNLTSVVVAFLLDATEILEKMISDLDSTGGQLAIDDRFLDRLQWITEQFGQNLSGTLDLESSQEMSSVVNQIKNLKK